MNKRTKTNIQTYIGVMLMLAIECVTILKYNSLDGNTSIVYYGEVMLLLGPWNYLISRSAVVMSSETIPYLIIFVAPVLVWAVYLIGLRWISKKHGLIMSYMVAGIMVALHITLGFIWGLSNTSWGP